ncbi:hypothetical protein BBP40_001386 [Aspergillus hancockii]|nr:hypothetical protein BBP40_001386 [Aspergillus hancockii]
MACSGEPICAACRERSLECVYALEMSKGRPRSQAQTQAQAANASASNTDRRSSPKTRGDSIASDGESSVAAELDAMYRERFRDEPPRVSTNLFQKRVTEFNRSLRVDSSNLESSNLIGAEPAIGIDYHGFLTLVTQELIETVMLKFSRLGGHAFFGSGERYYRASMQQDMTTTMFDTATLSTSASPATSSTSPVGVDPLAEYSSHLIAQLVDVWFTNHPLSILLSKTLLLRDSRSDSVNRVLLATLLADAHEFNKDPNSGVQGTRLREWVIEQLHSLLAGAADLVTGQITFLIGWRHACRGQARRAMCYIGYSGRIITRLRHQTEESPITEQTHINGVDRGAVVVEMIQSLWWAMLGTTVWCFIQMDMPFGDLLPPRLMQVLPPSRETSSTLLQLDRTTGNISTIQSQIASLQSISLLAHLSSLAAYLYALYPHPARGGPAASTPVPRWQDRLMLRLNQLMKSQRSLALVCDDAYKAVQDMIALVHTEATDDPVCLWLLSFYHTVSIYLLFPKQEIPGETQAAEADQIAGPAPVGTLTTSTLSGLDSAMQGLVSLFSHIKSAASSDAPRGSAASAFLHSYMLGLDATGRALTQILFAYDRAPIVEHGLFHTWVPRFLQSAMTLHHLFTQDILLKDHRWRLVKRQLKVTCKKLEEIGNTALDTSSGFGSLHPALEAPFDLSIYPPSALISRGPLSWPGAEPINRDRLGFDPIELPNLDMNPTSPLLDDHLEGDGIDLVQHSMPLAPFWTELRVPDLPSPNQQNNILARYGKRRADDSPSSDNLLGEMQTGKCLNLTLESPRIRWKRPKSDEPHDNA